MKFSEWLEKRQLLEVGTSTASVAVFSRPIGGMVTRNYPDLIATKKKKKKKKHSN